jgi:hypothetical protein
MVCSLILKISLGEIKGKMYKLLVKCDKCGHFFVFNETDKQPKEETPPSRPLPTPKEVISTQNLSTIDYKIDICCFSSKHTVLRHESKDWLVLNQDIYIMCLSLATCLPAGCCFCNCYVIRVSEDCYLAPSKQFFNYIMAKTSFISILSI